MSLAITEDHRALAEVARSFAGGQKLRQITRDALTVPPASLGAAWELMAELGWTGLHLPEQFGGSGYGLPELAIVVEELGAAVAPGPFLPAVIGSAIVDKHGDDSLRAALLPRLATGNAVAVHAPHATVTVDGGRLTGAVQAVPGAIWADYLLVAVGANLALVTTDSEAVTVRAASGALDPSLGLASVELVDAEAQVLTGAAAPATAIARALASAEASGGARATLASALDYAKVREQFGRTIGSFQAVKHHLANMLVEAEKATATAWDAARASIAAPEQSELASAIAAAVALRAYQINAQMNIQIHGGIGFTWEHDAHLYLRRSLSLIALYGDEAAALTDVHALAAAGVERQHAIELPPEAETFRAQAREFVAGLQAAPETERRRLVVESGYLVPHWPKPWGRDAGAVEQLVLDEEFADLELPNLGIGGWVLLTLTRHASPEQIERWIRPSLEGDLVWCQLFSEPGAGSDAAAVRTKAIRVDGGWQITGQKVWTSNAQNCNRGLATVRTDPSAAKHKGVTTVVVDMKAAGVEVRPLRELTGDAVFNEVFFDEVFIPDEDVVGEVNEGWTVARATLGNERVSIGGMARQAADARDVLTASGRSAPGDLGVQRDVAALIAADHVIQLLNLRRAARALAGSEPGAEGSVTKLLVSDQAQKLSEAGMRLIGVAGVDGTEPTPAREYLMARGLTIAGGTSEISRNVIAERLLGLPRDPLNR